MNKHKTAPYPFQDDMLLSTVDMEQDYVGMSPPSTSPYHHKGQYLLTSLYTR